MATCKYRKRRMYPFLASVGFSRWFAKQSFYHLNKTTRKPVGFMQSWNRTSHFKSHLLLIWNFQMRLEMRCAIWNFWNLSWKVAYLKLSDVTWNEMCYLKLLKLFKPIMEGCLFETFRCDLKWDVLFETFEKLSWRVAYLKLSDVTWNEMCYLKLLKPIMEGCLFETFRCDLKWDVLLETFGTWNFSTHHRGCLFESLRWDLKWDKLFETFETWNLKTFQPIKGVAHLKLSDETWKQDMLFETFLDFSTHHRGGLFETFEMFETWNCLNISWELLIWNFQMRLEKKSDIKTF